MSVPASYDLNAVAAALAAVFNNLDTGETLGGVPLTLNAYADVMGQIEVPALVLELDDLVWDETMGAGSDSFTFLAHLLVETQDEQVGQARLRSFMSRDGGMGKIKAALEADQTLGGLVSYAHMTGVRRIGNVVYNDVAYLGAELPIEVMS